MTLMEILGQIGNLSERQSKRPIFSRDILRRMRNLRIELVRQIFVLRDEVDWLIQRSKRGEFYQTEFSPETNQFDCNQIVVEIGRQNYRRGIIKHRNSNSSRNYDWIHFSIKVYKILRDRSKILLDDIGFSILPEMEGDGQLNLSEGEKEIFDPEDLNISETILKILKTARNSVWRSS